MSSSQKPQNHRERLALFYQKYNPEKLGSIDAILGYYTDHEEDLFRELVTRYGPEPWQLASSKSERVITAPSTTAGAVSREEYLSVLVPFYQKHNPERIPQLDRVLNYYRGKEKELWSELVKKYGADAVPTMPGAPSDSTSTARPSRDAYRAALTTFYMKHRPEKVSQIDTFLDYYEGREDTYFEELRKKYGEMPIMSGSAASASPNTTTTTSPTNPHADRLRRFFQHYDPSQLPNIDATLAMFQNNEEELMRNLVSRYGPEPSGSDGSQPPSNATPILYCRGCLRRTLRVQQLTCSGCDCGEGGRGRGERRAPRSRSRYDDEEYEEDEEDPSFDDGPGPRRQSHSRPNVQSRGRKYDYDDDDDVTLNVDSPRLRPASRSNHRRAFQPYRPDSDKLALAQGVDEVVSPFPPSSSGPAVFDDEAYINKKSTADDYEIQAERDLVLRDEWNGGGGALPQSRQQQQQQQQNTTAAGMTSTPPSVPGISYSPRGDSMTRGQGSPSHRTGRECRAPYVLVRLPRNIDSLSPRGRRRN
eukprot:PhM_4_TR5184/c0_g1_i1/m.99140